MFRFKPAKPWALRQGASHVVEAGLAPLGDGRAREFSVAGRDLIPVRVINNMHQIEPLAGNSSSSNCRACRNLTFDAIAWTYCGVVLAYLICLSRQATASIVSGAGPSALHSP